MEIISNLFLQNLVNLTNLIKNNFVNKILHIFLDPNANQFVNQGYNNISFAGPQSQSPRAMQPLQQQPSGTRIIPVQIERSNGSQNRSPYPEQTVVMQG